MKNLLVLLCLTALTFGCATSHILTGKQRPSVSPDSVKVYSTMPPGAEEVALLNGNARSYGTDGTVRRIKIEAAKLGANGIVIQDAHANFVDGAQVSAKAIFVP